jgi:hypothetical protein
MKTWSLRTFAGTLATLGSLAAVIALQEIRPQRPTTEGVTFAYNERIVTLPPEAARLLTFGYDRALASLLWLRFLQYTPMEKVPPGEISWLYFDLATIAAIDPNFINVFDQGGLFLSVIAEDRRGAREILEKGVQLHPDRWRMHANLAYHYEWELGRRDLAGPEYLAASKLPGAPWLMSLLASTYLAKNESPEAAISFLRTLAEGSGDKAVREKFEEKIGKLERGKEKK